MKVQFEKPARTRGHLFRRSAISSWTLPTVATLQSPASGGASFPALCGRAQVCVGLALVGIVRPATDFQGTGYSRENAIGIETAACPQIVLIARYAFCAALQQAEWQQHGAISKQLRETRRHCFA